MNESFIQCFVIPAIPMLVVTGGLVTLGAIVGYFAARQVQPISFLKSLAISWLAIGLGCFHSNRGVADMAVASPNQPARMK